jgi:hypothetical protein
MATKIIPTFLLKGLDHRQVVADYKAGVFNRPVGPKSKITIASTGAILAPTYSSSNTAPVFCVKDKNNGSVVIATTGHRDFEIFTTNNGSLPVGGRCEYCKYDFETDAVGYPIGHQETLVLTNDTPDPHAGVYRTIYSFWVEGQFCSFECALGYVRNILSRPSEYRDTTIRDSERLLKLLYKLTYPEASILRPAQDPRLLQFNGGSLTREAWQHEQHVYVRTDRVLMIPAKVEYIQHFFINQVVTIDMSRDPNKAIAAAAASS